MRTMVLNRYHSRNAETASVHRRDILGMRIMHHQQFFGTNFIHRDQVLNCFLKSTERLIVPQVADVLADESLAIDDEGDRILEIGADGQNRTLARNGCDGSGGVATRAAQNGRTNTPTRATESSTRRAIGRSPIRKASAIPDSRSSASSSS